MKFSASKEGGEQLAAIRGERILYLKGKKHGKEEMKEPKGRKGEERNLLSRGERERSRKDQSSL